jgi:hypothetical protein
MRLTNVMTPPTPSFINRPPTHRPEHPSWLSRDPGPDKVRATEPHQYRSKHERKKANGLVSGSEGKQR